VGAADAQDVRQRAVEVGLAAVRHAREQSDQLLCARVVALVRVPCDPGGDRGGAEGRRVGVWGSRFVRGA